MSDFIFSSTRSENVASGICRDDKYRVKSSMHIKVLMQTDERAGSRIAHRFKSFQSINVGEGTSADTGMASQ